MPKPKRKLLLVSLSLSVLTIGFLVLWLIFTKQTTKWALALPDETWVPLKGWIWTDTIGWLSVNNKNDGGRCVDSGGNDGGKCAAGGVCLAGYTCQKYWVAVDESTGTLDGYAWSEHVGWVAFKPAGFCGQTAATADYKKPCENSSNCDAGFSCYLDYNTPPAASSCPNGVQACYKNDRKFYGWARVLSLASADTGTDAGWIKLDGNDLLAIGEEAREADGQGSLLPSGKPGTTWGDLSGWAFNGASNSNGLGWFSFNCINNSACAASNYKVSARPDNMGGVSLQRQDGNDSYEIKVSWLNNIYGTSWFEVWRKNGECRHLNQPTGDHCSGATQAERDAFCPQPLCDVLAHKCVFKGSQTGESCNTNADCAQAACQLQDYQQVNNNPAHLPVTASDYNDKNLQLFVNYEYVVRACNIFACSRSGAATSLRTSPIEDVRNFKAVPICDTDNNPPASFVDLNWSRAAIVSAAVNQGVSLVSYQIQYCLLDVRQDITNCNWQTAAPDCNDPAYNGQATQSCREKLTQATGRYKSQDFSIYRLRAIGNKGTCLGGNNDGKDCPANDCVPGGGTCDIYKSSWSYSNTFRVCPVASSYEERRPQ